MRQLAVAILVFLAVLLMASIPKSHAHDDGRYADSPNHAWFDSLTSPYGGRCCAEADGLGVNDLEWKTAIDEAKPNLRYQVFIAGDWRDVYEGNVVNEPNKIGRAVVWFWYHDGKIEIRCFMPGNFS
jgi:hypothetical protein